MSKYLKYIVILLALLFPLDAYSEKTKQTQNEDAASEQSIDNGIVPGIISIFPGVILHGSGHLIGGDIDTGLDLILMEGIGLLTIIGSGAVLAYSGASGKTVIPIMPVITGGMGLFIISWFADIYGSFFGNRIVARSDYNRYIEIYSGLTFVDDPQFEYTSFVNFSMEFGYHGWQLHPQAWFAVDDNNKRYSIKASRQLIGHSGFFLDRIKDALDLQFTNRFGYHIYGTEKFEKRWIDLSFTGILNMGHIWKSLNGSFVQFETGYNGEWVYFMLNDNIPADYTDQYLFVFGYGIFIGNEKRPYGELVLYYNHRRDDLAGGLGQGFTGFIGLDIDVNFLSCFKTKIELKAGSALMAGVLFSYLY